MASLGRSPKMPRRGPFELPTATQRFLLHFPIHHKHHPCPPALQARPVVLPGLPQGVLGARCLRVLLLGEYWCVGSARRACLPSAGPISFLPLCANASGPGFAPGMLPPMGLPNFPPPLPPNWSEHRGKLSLLNMADTSPRWRHALLLQLCDEAIDIHAPHARASRSRGSTT